MPSIENLLSEERFLAWQESIQRKLKSSDGEVYRGILKDVEEATNYPPKGNALNVLGPKISDLRRREKPGFWAKGLVESELVRLGNPPDT